MITENLSTLKIHKLSKAQYERELAAGNLDENAIYLTPDEEIDLSPYATIEQLNGKADVEHDHDDKYYTESEVDAKLATKSDSTHNHDSAYDAKGAASDALTEAKAYADTKTSGLASTPSVTNAISTHNTATDTHNDIRDLITGLTNRLNALADSDDTTLDQMSELVAYIKANRDLIDSVTTSKVNVADIIDNLTTNVANKPLSAAQGVAIKALIDELQSDLDSHTHVIDDVSGLQASLDGKADKDHIHANATTTTAGFMSAADKVNLDTLAAIDFDTLELITVEDIDAIWGTSIQVATASEVTF